MFAWASPAADLDATPGLAEAGNEFYSVVSHVDVVAERLRQHRRELVFTGLP